MPSDRAVIEALEESLRRDVGNVVLRLHLVHLLLAAERAEAALDHARRVLAGEPDHQEALKLAGEACRRLGDEERAVRYRRLAGLDPAGEAPAAEVEIGTPGAEPAGDSAAPQTPPGERLADVVPLRRADLDDD